MDKLVVIPTFNERENISNVIHAIFNLDEGFHVLVIDDGSPDGTAQIVKELQSKFSRQLFLKERRGKLGLGTAYIYGFKWALANAIVEYRNQHGNFSSLEDLKKISLITDETFNKIKPYLKL